MGRARKIDDERDARRCLLAAQLAGQSAGEWGRAHGVDGRSLRAWGVKLAGERGPGSPRRRDVIAGRPGARALVELVPPAPAVIAAGRYVLEIAGARVEFGDDASVSNLRCVVEALRGC